MNYRRLAAFVGIAALGVSVLAIVAPELVALGLEWNLVAIIGLVVLVQALRVLQRRRREELDEATVPDPERSIAAPPPGEEFERVLEQFLDSRGGYYHRARVRNGLRSAAVTVLTRYQGYVEADAEAAVAAGTWTDDRYAAGFLGDETASDSSLRTRVRDLVRRESAFDRDVRRTVDAIAANAGSTEQSPDRTDRSRGDRDESAADAASADSSSRFSTAMAYDSDRFDDEADPVIARRSHSTGHWRGVSAVALVGIGVGLLLEQPAVLLAGVVGVGYAAYARSSAFAPGSVSVSVERSLGADDPEPGDDVEVTVTVTNESDRFLPDLRFVDGVPEALAVADGSARFGTALRPGESEAFSYTVTARRGVHAFGPTLLVARDLPGATEQKQFLPAATTLTCLPPLRPLTEPVPLREQTTQYGGRVATETGGEGLEFYATREYRHGDAMRRIDWNRRARTGELTTIEFREERAATVVVVIDAREAAYVAPSPDTPHAVDRAVDAASAFFTALAESGDRVGIAAVSSESCWLAPGSGAEHRLEARELLATHPALAPVPSESPLAAVRTRTELRERLAPGTQVLFLTPLCDEPGTRFARRLDAYGYPVTVVSPDPTADRTNGHRLARVARDLRISELRRTGIPVIDWPWDESVDVAVARYNERWSE